MLLWKSFQSEFPRVFYNVVMSRNQTESDLFSCDVSHFHLYSCLCELSMLTCFLPHDLPVSSSGLNQIWGIATMTGWKLTGKMSKSKPFVAISSLDSLITHKCKQFKTWIPTVLFYWLMMASICSQSPRQRTVSQIFTPNFLHMSACCS